MWKRQILACLFLAGFGLAAQAQEAAPATPKSSPNAQQPCKDHPGTGGRFKERHEAFCKDNPQRCEEMKAKREQMREQCKQDPAACEKKREEMRTKMKERFEERCKADPQRCEAMKKRWEEHQQQRPTPGKAPAQEGASPAVSPTK